MMGRLWSPLVRGSTRHVTLLQFIAPLHSPIYIYYVHHKLKNLQMAFTLIFLSLDIERMCE